jgi:type III pantothenate kinase
MGNMNLCIDIGNTSTKAAVFRNGKEVSYFKPFEVSDLVGLKEKYRDLSILSSISGSNPKLEKELKLSEVLTHETSLPIFLDYKTPETLGRDRIAAAVGAHYIDKKSNWIIVDLGTCLTLDVLVDGVFLGGLISPGVQMRFKAMNQFTAGLPLANQNYTTGFPGKSTIESLQVGVCKSVIYEINGYIRQLNEQYSDLKIVDCSSQNILFDKEVKNEIFARPKLVVEGLSHILDYNADK